MAEEDILFGKNRHLFGGIAPSDMRLFRAKYNPEDKTATIEYIAPGNTVIDGQTVCVIGGVEFRRYIFKRSELQYVLAVGSPIYDEFKGDLVYKQPRTHGMLSGNLRYTITDTGLNDVGYDYLEEIPVYRAFPYSDQGVYNRNVAGMANFATFIDTSKMYEIYGYDLQLGKAIPSARVSYPSDVDNAKYTPAYMDFTNDAFNYGGWGRDEYRVEGRTNPFFMPQPCMLTYDGVVDHYLDNDNYNRRSGIVTASSVADSTFNGNAMMRWPKIYTHREIVDDVYKFRCSNVKLGDDWECWSNYNINDEMVDCFYTPIYNGCEIDSKLRSLSGISTSDIMTSDTFSNVLSRAESNSSDKRWSIDTLSDTLLIQDLLVMMARTTDLRSAYGYGVCNGTTKIATGTMNDKGLFWGSQNSTDGVKVFGMENWWGNYARTVAGLLMYSGQVYAKYTPGMRDGTKCVSYRAVHDQYLETGSKFIYSGETYIANMTLTPAGLIPNRSSRGSSSTYWCNSVYANTSSSTYPAVFGRHPNSTDAEVGPFTLGFATSTTSTGNIMNAAPSYR